MILFRLAFLSLFALIALAPASAVAKSKGGEAQTGEWKGFIAIDAANGNVLAQDNPDLITPPASMTKLMTFAVLYDKLQSGSIALNTPVKINSADAKMGGTQVFLDPSETFPVEDLMYAMMIQSANDAAHALARASAGSVEAFVDLMNAKARELGMTRTTFRSPHGLPPSSRRIADGDLTTPRDYATLCRYLLMKTDVLKYSSVKVRDFGLSRPRGPQHMINHNKLLGTVEGVDGLKTGYTQGAGYCLSATATASLWSSWAPSAPAARSTRAAAATARPSRFLTKPLPPFPPAARISPAPACPRLLRCRLPPVRSVQMRLVAKRTMPRRWSSSRSPASDLIGQGKSRQSPPPCQLCYSARDVYLSAQPFFVHRLRGRRQSSGRHDQHHP